MWLHGRVLAYHMSGPGFDPQHSQYIKIQFHLNLRIDLFLNVDIRLFGHNLLCPNGHMFGKYFFFFPDSGLFLISTGIFQRSALTLLNPAFPFLLLPRSLLCVSRLKSLSKFLGQKSLPYVLASGL